MAINFTKKDVDLLKARYSFLLKQLEDVLNYKSFLNINIINAVNDFLAGQLLSILKGISCEELSVSKEGIRVKLLISAGYENYAQLYFLTQKEIAAIDGIGDHQAQLIKKIVGDAAAEAKKTLKLQLSVDDKNEFSEKIVVAVAATMTSAESMRYCAELYNTLQSQEQNIRISFERVRKSVGAVKRLFVSNQEKQLIEQSYAYLYDFFYGQFGAAIEGGVEKVHNDAKVDSATAWKLFSENTIAFYQIIEDVMPGVLGNTDAMHGLPQELAEQVETQEFSLEGLHCTLRHYQLLGLKYILHQKNCLLGDEMGLGKTIQAIAAMAALRNEGQTHFMVVCPASVLINWIKEIYKHSDLKPLRIHGSHKAENFQTWLDRGGVVVTTYESTQSLAFEEAFTYGMLVVDEAHYIKNPEAIRSRNVKKLSLNAQRILFMTGTALENNVEEMIHLITLLNPRVAFEAQKLAFMSGAEQFRQKIAPVYYRRKREDVLTELPEKIENEEWINLNDEELAVYQADTLERDFNKMRRVSWSVEDLENSSKALRLREIIEEATEDDRKIIVFSFYLDVTKKIKAFLGDRCLDIINGSVPPQRRQEIIDSFEKAPAGTVLIAQIVAGGTGLNIQSASVVIICEPQLKPSIENQAISRAYRMGQSRTVMVHRLLGDETVDESILQLLETKQARFDAFADISEAAKAQEELELSKENQKEIIEREVERFTAAALTEGDDEEKTVTEADSDNPASDAVDNSGNNPFDEKSDDEESNS